MTDDFEEVRRLMDAIDAFEAIEDDTACAIAVSKALAQWPEHHSRLRAIRQRRVQALKEQGKTWKEIAAIIGGVTPARAQQIAAGLSGAVRSKRASE